MKLQKYLFRSTILSLYELMSLSGLNHCDIKPDNIMLSDDLQCRLFDYGHACKVGKTLYHITGTYQYAAPEIHYSIPYQPEGADMFDLGILLYILMFQNIPFNEATERDPRYRLVM